MQLFEISTAIKHKRQEVKCTQANLAKGVSISLNSVKKIEAGFLDEVGIKKVESVLDFLDLEFCVRPKGRPATLDELNEKA